MPGKPFSMPPKPCVDAPLPEEEVYERSLKNSFYTHARGAAPTPSRIVTKVVNNMFTRPVMVLQSTFPERKYLRLHSYGLDWMLICRFVLRGSI